MHSNGWMKAQLCEASKAACGVSSFKELQAQRRQRKKQREATQQAMSVPGMPVSIQQVLQPAPPHQLHMHGLQQVAARMPCASFPSAISAPPLMLPRHGVQSIQAVGVAGAGTVNSSGGESSSFDSMNAALVTQQASEQSQHVQELPAVSEYQLQLKLLEVRLKLAEAQRDIADAQANMLLHAIISDQ